METRLSFRRALPEDAKLLFDWANDPGIRASALSTEPIAWEVHEAWLKGKLTNPDCVIFIAEAEGNPVGQIRFDIHGDNAEVDVHTAPEARGKGYGTAIIAEGAAQIFSMTDVRHIEACVKPENEASAKAFLKAGFQEKGEKTVRGQALTVFTLPHP